MENNFLKDKKVGMPTILGSTTINHASRIKLELNCSEYVLMDYIDRCVRNNRGVDTMEAYRQTGFNETEQGQLLTRLVQKGFVIPEDCNPPKITSKWAGAFTDIEKEFEELFWRRKGKVFFTGSKKASLKFYIALRKKYSSDFVLAQKEAYAEYLDMEHKRGFDRAVMMAERWLNPTNEYYMTDWKTMAEEIQKKIAGGQIKLEKNTQPMTKTEVVTAEQRRKEYEQDSNQ